MEKANQFRKFVKGVIASIFAFATFSLNVYADEGYVEYSEQEIRGIEQIEFAKATTEKNIQNELIKAKRDQIEEFVPPESHFPGEVLCFDFEEEIEEDISEKPEVSAEEEFYTETIPTIEAFSKSVDNVEFEVREILDSSVVDISVEEYYFLCRMTYAESGHCSWEMQNACASAAIHQLQKEHETDETVTMEWLLLESGRFGNGEFRFNDNGTRRKVEISDLTPSVYDAVNTALQGYDVTEESIGGALGFYAPNYCSQETKEYFNAHISGTTQIENVVFFHEWH